MILDHNALESRHRAVAPAAMKRLHASHPRSVPGDIDEIAVQRIVAGTLPRPQQRCLDLYEALGRMFRDGVAHDVIVTRTGLHSRQVTYYRHRLADADCG